MRIALPLLLLLGACRSDTTLARARQGGHDARCVRRFEAVPVWGTSETCSLRVDDAVFPLRGCPGSAELRFSPDGRRVALRAAGSWSIVDLRPDGGTSFRRWDRPDLDWKDVWAASPLPVE